MDGDEEAWELMLRSGCCTQPWLAVRPVLTTRLVRSVEEFDRASPLPCADAQERVARLVTMLEEFDEAPFTLQRLCEVIAEPHRFFRAFFCAPRALVRLTARRAGTTDSFLFGLDKLCSVSSTMQPATRDKVDRLLAAYAAVADPRRSAPPPPPPPRLQSPPSPPLAPRQSNGVQDWFDA